MNKGSNSGWIINKGQADGVQSRRAEQVELIDEGIWFSKALTNTKFSMSRQKSLKCYKSGVL